MSAQKETLVLGCGFILCAAWPLMFPTSLALVKHSHHGVHGHGCAARDRQLAGLFVINLMHRRQTSLQAGNSPAPAWKNCCNFGISNFAGSCPAEISRRTILKTLRPILGVARVWEGTKAQQMSPRSCQASKASVSTPDARGLGMRARQLMKMYACATTWPPKHNSTARSGSLLSDNRASASARQRSSWRHKAMFVGSSLRLNVKVKPKAP